jgi:hypothetical protein
MIIKNLKLSCGIAYSMRLWQLSALVLMICLLIGLAGRRWSSGGGAGRSGGSNASLRKAGKSVADNAISLTIAPHHTGRDANGAADSAQTIASARSARIALAGVRSYLVNEPRHSEDQKRVHVVCPSNGACTAFTLALCTLLEAGCVSDFSCLTPMQQDDIRLLKALAPSATTSLQTLDMWRRSRASVVVKNTISSGAPAILERLTANVRLPQTAKPSWLERLDASRSARPVASSAWPHSGFFSHRILFLRDPVQQYLALRVKYWCDNCGGFAEKIAAQEALLRRCLRGRSVSCPFDAVLFDSDLYSAALPQLLAMLGLLPQNSSSLISRVLHCFQIRPEVIRARNAQLKLPADLMSLGNMQGSELQPRLSVKRDSYNCGVEQRARTLMPTLFALYHPSSCMGPHVRNGTDAAVIDQLDHARGRRNSKERARRCGYCHMPVPLVCDSYISSSDTDCGVLPKYLQAPCERVGLERGQPCAALPRYHRATCEKRLPSHMIY